MFGLPCNSVVVSGWKQGVRRSLFGRTPFVLGLPLLLTFASQPAFSAPVKDAAAEKALQQAMDEEYFETRFDKAEEKLRAAIDACGTGCSPGVKAKLYGALGTVLAGGKKELEDAQAAFVEALKLDASLVPDKDLATAQVSFAFEKAKAELKLGPTSAGGGTPAATHKPPAAQRVRTPLPLYLEISPETLADVRKVTGSYAGTGTETFGPLTFRKIGERGYGAEVPCEDVGTEGDLKYFITVLGENDKVVASFGSRTEPLKVPLKTAITSEAPRWPGFSAPEQCTSKSGAATQCLDDKQCNSGLVCRSGECVAPPTEKKSLANWVTVTFAPDFGLFAAENICTRVGQESDGYVCQREDGSRYLGTPTLNVADNVNFGFLVGTMRVTAQYERVIWNNFSAALRVGFAFNGAQGDDVNLFPLHLEARLAYSIGANAFEGIGVRPFAFLSAGGAQVDTGVKVEVLEDGATCGAETPTDPGSPCTKPNDLDKRIEPRTQKLDAYKRAGFGFATVGVGLVYRPLKNVGLHLAVRGGVTFPVLIGIISPEAGFTFGF